MPALEGNCEDFMQGDSMRILHTSDWHLGITIHGYSMLVEQGKFIDEFILLVKEQNIDMVIIAGDVYDSTVSSSEAINLYNKLVTTLCYEMNIPTIIIAGNHDGAARLAACSQLLKKSNLYITGKLTGDIKPDVFHDVAVYSVPYFNIDEVRALYPTEEIKNYSQAMKIILDDIRKTMDTQKMNIAVSHGFISGAELSDSDKAAMIGTANMISKDVFEGFDYVALGHLHRPQKLSDTVHYAGSPLKYSFGEAGQSKAVKIIDSNSRQVTSIPIVQPKEMKLIQGTYEACLAIMEMDSNREDLTKVIVEDRYVGLEMLDLFRSYYPNLLSVTGKSIDTADGQVTITIDEIQRLTPVEILEKFCIEMADFTVSARQKKMFEEAFSKAEEGGELS